MAGEGPDRKIAETANPGAFLRIGGEILVNTAVLGDQEYQAITALPNGGFVVTWTDRGVAHDAIKAQVYGADGAHVGGEILVNTTTPAGLLADSQITALADGGFVVT